MVKRELSETITFHQYVTDSMLLPFEWGKHDCILFVITWVNHKTKKNHLQDIPEWNSAKSGMRIVESLGGMEKIFNDRFTPINPNLAKDGDIGVWNGCMGLFSGPHLICTGVHGIEHIERTQIKCAWSY